MSDFDRDTLTLNLIHIYHQKIFTIELTELGNRNFVNYENMQVEDIKDLGMQQKFDNLFKEEGDVVEEMIFKNLKFN